MFISTSGVEITPERPLVSSDVKLLYKGHFVTLTEIAHVCIIKKKIEKREKQR